MWKPLASVFRRQRPPSSLKQDLRTAPEQRTRFVTREGTPVEADEVFAAWTSGDLDRMLAARHLPTNPVDRHYLLLGIVEQSRRRDGEKMERLCFETATAHLAEFPALIEPLRRENGMTPEVPTFRILGSMLEKRGEYERAIQVYETALEFGVPERTKGGYKERLEYTQWLEKRTGAPAV